MFVMRLSNDRDQALIRSAISDAGASMLTFVPSLAPARCSRLAPAFRCRRG